MLEIRGISFYSLIAIYFLAFPWAESAFTLALLTKSILVTSKFSSSESFWTRYVRDAALVLVLLHKDWKLFLLIELKIPLVHKLLWKERLIWWCFEKLGWAKFSELLPLFSPRKFGIFKSYSHQISESRCFSHSRNFSKFENEDTQNF